jgi:hypothetical protein
MITTCPYCEVDSAGNHSYGCPSRSQQFNFTVDYLTSKNDSQKLNEILELLKEIKHLLVGKTFK